MQQMGTSVSFITGASSGIGRALALELAARGHRLSLAARRGELLHQLSREISHGGEDVLTVRCDVAVQNDVKHAVAATVERFGRIDLAILSAGVSGKMKASHFQAARLESIFSINVLGVAYCLEELIPLMKSQGGGTIAVISSIAAERALSDSAVYSSSKSSVSKLFDGMRGPLAREGIRLVTIEPGFVHTEMTAGMKTMPFVMDADAAARLILRRLDRGDRIIRFPLIPSVFMKVIGILPAWLFDALTTRRVEKS